MPTKVKEPTAEQRRMLIVSKLHGMTIEELRKVYSTTTRVMDKRRAAGHNST